MSTTGLVLFSLFWIVFIYTCNSIFQKKFLIPDYKISLLYISTVALIGVFGEVFINSIYNFVFGVPLWEYHLFPIHNSYTSYYSLYIWGLYGFHLYLFHNNRNSTAKNIAIMISIEAIILEVIFNSSFLLLTGQFIFYYLPNDLWHVTSLQAIPFYFLAGLIIVKSLKRFLKDPFFFTIMTFLITVVFVFFT